MPQINSRICRKKEKKKARITPLKIYINRRVFLAIGSNNKDRRSERSLSRRKREEREKIMI